jgi:hypothetical protein
MKIILAFLFALQQVDLKLNPVEKKSFPFVILNGQESIPVNNIKVQLIGYLKQIKDGQVVNDVAQL